MGGVSLSFGRTVGVLALRTSSDGDWDHCERVRTILTMTPSRKTGRHVVAKFAVSVALVFPVVLAVRGNTVALASTSSVVRLGVVHGLVTVGPTCPVQTPNEKCSRPLQLTVVVRSKAGTTVDSTRSDASGRYAIRLSPGVYILVAVTVSRWPHCPPKPVTVRAGRTTRANISCDSGIR